jgi:hypothetical protein
MNIDDRAYWKVFESTDKIEVRNIGNCVFAAECEYDNRSQNGNMCMCCDRTIEQDMWDIVRSGMCV